MHPDGSCVLIGSGGFSKVYAGHYRGQDVAVKVLKQRGQTAGLLTAMLKEAAVMRHCMHHSILRFHGVSFDAGVAMVVELMDGGDLFHALHRGQGAADYLWASARGKRIALQVAQGILYLHAQRLVHCDIKSLNVLLSKDGQVAKIGDMGMSKFQHATLVSKAGEVGSLPWAAPELLADSRVSEKVDIFSLGVVLWEVVTGEMPQRGARRMPRVPQECSAEVLRLIQACNQADPAARPSAAEVVAVLECEVAPGEG